MTLRNAPFLSLLCLLTMHAMAGTPALAQNVPPSAEIDRVKPEEFTLQPDEAVTAPATETGTPRPQAMPENADQLMFVLKSVSVSGNTVFSTSDLAPLWQNDLGKNIPLTRVYEIADAISKKYRDAGYVLARAYIPAQEIDGGEVIIKIAEGKLGDVKVEGPFEVEGPLARAIADIKTMQPLNIQRVERWALRLNDFYGAQFKVVLAELPGDDGAVGIVLVGTKRQKIEAGLTYDNSGSRFLGPHTVTASAAINHMDSHFQRTEIAATTSMPVDEMKSISVTHRIPLNANGWALNLNANAVNGNPGYELKTLDIKSKSRNASAEIAWTPVRQRDQILVLSTKFDAYVSDTDISGLDFSHDSIRSVRLNASYQLTDKTGAQNNIELGLDKGLDGFMGASEKDDPDLSRAQGDPGYTKLTFNLSRRQNLGAKLQLAVQATGQTTNVPLLSSEEFGYGGSKYGRAYDPSEIVGDKGVAASAELRYQPFETGLGLFQPFVFYDIGKVWNIDAAQAQEESGASAGLGARYASDFGVNASVTLAKPLTRRVETPQSYTDEKGTRLQLNLSATY